MTNNTIITSEYVFFLSSYLSQWHPSPFKWHGINYRCAEQFMMAEKARLFGDEETRKKILCATSPAEHKSLGRAVKNYNEQEWIDNRYDIVYVGNFLKFTQNPELATSLLNDGKNRGFVECNPKDSIWGVALGLDSPDIYDENKWQGKNLLGNILNKVRFTLMNETLLTF